MSGKTTAVRCEMTTVASGGKRRCSRSATYRMRVPRENRERMTCTQHAEHLIFYYDAREVPTEAEPAPPVSSVLPVGQVNP